MSTLSRYVLYLPAFNSAGLFVHLLAQGAQSLRMILFMLFGGLLPVFWGFSFRRPRPFSDRRVVFFSTRHFRLWGLRIRFARFRLWYFGNEHLVFWRTCFWYFEHQKTKLAQPNC